MKKSDQILSKEEIRIKELETELNSCKIALEKHRKTEDLNTVNGKMISPGTILNEIDLVFNNTEECFVIVNRNLEIVSFNLKFARLSENYFNIKIKEKQSILDLVQNGRQEIVKEVYQNVFKGETLKTEISVAQPDDSKRIILNHFKPATNVNGEIVGAFVSITDITEERNAEELISKNEAHFQALVENSLDAVVILSAEGRLTYASPSIKHVLGFTVEEALEIDLSQFVHPDDFPVVALELGEVLANPGRIFRGTVSRIKHKNGSWRWCESTITNLLHDPAVNGIVDNFRDITEQVEAENKLRVKREQLQKIMDQSLDLICTLDEEGRFLNVSVASKTILGYSPDELIGKNYRDLIYNEDIQNSILEENKLKNRKKVKNFENRIVRKDGRIVNLLWSVKWDDKEKRMYSIGRDTTELRKREKQINEYNQRVKNILNSISDPFYALNEKQEFIYMNSAAEDQFNRSGEQVIGKNLYKEFPEVKKFGMDKRIAEVYKTGKPFRFEVFYEPFNNWFDEVIYPTNEGVTVYFKNITDKKRSEIELQRTLLDKDQMLERLRDGFFAVDNNWIVTYWNKEAEYILNTPREQILNKNLWEVFENAVSLKFYSEYNRAIDEQVAVRFEEYFHPIQKWVEVNAYPSESGLSVYFRDITDAKNAIDKIKKSEEQRSLIMNTALDAIIWFDSKGLITFWNPKAEKIFAYKSDEVQGKNFAELIFPENYNKGQNKGILSFFTSGEGLTFNEVQELSAINKEKEEFPIELTILPIKQEEEEFYCAFIRDITDRKKSELEKEKFVQIIQKYNSQLEASQQIARLGYWELEPDGRTIYWSNQMYEICGIEKGDEVIRSHVFMNMIHPEDKLRFIDEHAIAVKSGDKLNVEFRFIRPDGQVKNLVGRGGLVYNKTGNVLYMEGTMQDITYLKENERILEELNNQLEKRAQELSVSNAELEQFAYIASHDLQEPLRMVTGFLTQLEKKYKDQLDSKAHQYIGFAVDGAVRMRKIILDLLEYSRVGRQDYKKEEINMNDLVSDVLRLSHTVITEKQALVNAADLPVIYACKTPLMQVLQNLISNALKYNKPANNSIIDIKANETDSHWMFAVQDNGIGIDPRFFDKIFIIFQRLHNKEEYSGTGIGLAICKKIIENHQGEIWIESEEGNGSTFYFSIAKPDKRIKTS